MTYPEFKAKYNNKYIDYDGAYGGQCWDLGQYYFTEVLKLSPSLLSGTGLVSNILKGSKYTEFLKHFVEVKNTEMVGGDVCIWVNGHIAIFDHWDNNTKANYYFSQNPNPSQVIRINRKDQMRSFRFKGNIKKEPTKEVVRDLQKAFNSSYNAGLAEDNDNGPLTEEACRKYYLYYKIPTIKNDHVRWVQQRYKDKGYSITVDGSFGPESKAVTLQFQKDNGLVQDGFVGLETHKKLIG